MEGKDIKNTLESAVSVDWHQKEKERMACICRYIRKLIPDAYREFGKNKADRIIKNARVRYSRLCEENAEETKEVRAHTRKRIYPAVAVFQAMLEEKVERGAAAEILNNYYEKQSEPIGAAIRGVLRIPALYRLVPRFFAKMTKISFGEKAGFMARWLRADKKEMRFDMLLCPYQDICIRYGCPEIVQGFCRADDICYGNMHPRLHWGRTKTLGLGGDCCDFRVTVR